MLLGSANYLLAYQSPFDKLRVTTSGSAATFSLMTPTQYGEFHQPDNGDIEYQSAAAAMGGLRR
jgi:hypothetical protein